MEKEVIISNGKIKANLKKYWYIPFLLFILGVSIAAFSGFKKERMDKTQYFQAVVNFELDWNTKSETEEKVNIRLNLLNGIQSKMTSNEVIREVNQKLEKKNYNLLGEGDDIKIDLKTEQYFSLVVSGKNDVERTKYITEQLSEVLAEKMESELDISRCRTSGNIVIYKASYNSLGELEHSFQEIQEDEEIEENSGYSKEIDKKMLLLPILALVLGFAVIAFFIIKDQRIYSEMEMPEQLLCIGRIREGGDEINMLAMPLLSRCRKNHWNSVNFVAVGDINSMQIDLITTYMKENGLDVKCIGHFMQKAYEVKDVISADGIILVVEIGYDKNNELDLILHALSVAQINIIGYIMKMPN